MSLHVPPGTSCTIPGCRGTVTHRLAIRMRRIDTGADWAPDTNAYFCERHATHGADVTLLYVPMKHEQVVTHVVTASLPITRRTPIKRRMGVKT